MADWITLEKKAYLTVEDMAAFDNNFNYLRDYFLSFNFSVGELRDVTVAHNISPISIQQKFNDVEYNMQTLQHIISDILGANIENFKNHTWQKYPINLKAEIWRWIDWFNEVKKWEIHYTNLLDINGEIITDINDEPLQVLKVFKEVN